MRPAIIARTLLALALIWVSVWLVRGFAGSLKATATLVEQRIGAAGFEAPPPQDPAAAAARETQLRDIAALINRLDYQERLAHRRLGTAARLFETLSPPEQGLFVDLTVTPALESFLDSMAALPPKQRQRFIDQGTKELTAEADGRAPALGMLRNLDVDQLRAGLKVASPRVKFQLAPVVEAINDALQGMNGPEFGPRRQN